MRWRLSEFLPADKCLRGAQCFTMLHPPSIMDSLSLRPSLLNLVGKAYSVTFREAWYLGSCRCVGCKHLVLFQQTRIELQTSCEHHVQQLDASNARSEWRVLAGRVNPEPDGGERTHGVAKMHSKCNLIRALVMRVMPKRLHH